MVELSLILVFTTTTLSLAITSIKLPERLVIILYYPLRENKETIPLPATRRVSRELYLIGYIVIHQLLKPMLTRVTYVRW